MKETDSHIYFHEEQKFQVKWWFWVMLSIIPLMFIFVFLIGRVIFVFHPPEITNVPFFIFAFIVATFGFPLSILSRKIEVIITENGIRCRMPPEFFWWRVIPFDRLVSFKPYQFIKSENSRLTWWVGGKFRIEGADAIEIVRLRGDNITIGTQRQLEFLAALEQAKSDYIKKKIQNISHQPLTDL